MGIFDFLRGPDINGGVEEYKKTAGAVLLDVRTREEFSQGHIPGAVNVPLQEISRVESKVPDTGTKVFTCCLSGARSAQAAAYLKRMGYQNVTNIGGISAYRGKEER